MRPDAILVSETEAAEQLEELLELADIGQLIMLAPVNGDKAKSAA